MLKRPINMSTWKENNLREYFDQNRHSAIEGIYEKLNDENSKHLSNYKLGVVASESDYDIIYLSGALNYLDWSEGEKKGKIIKTSKNFYKVEWVVGGKNFLAEEVWCHLDKDDLLSFSFGKNDVIKFLKLYPTFSDTKNSTIPIDFTSSGTGFLISQNGLIVTNHHVIKNASKINVEVTQIGMRKSYAADIVLSDERNDLAILKIKDNNFYNSEGIPFTLKHKVSDMGTKVFTLGYPLTETMGESIKLNDGLISSKMGFQGDISSYQLSVPVHPGNSGGPLFDFDGNLVGVINAKHLLAENATYAIKSNVLKNLIEILPSPPDLPQINKLAGMSLPEQIKIIENFVFLIKTK